MLLAREAHGFKHLLEDGLIGFPDRLGSDKYDEPHSFRPESGDNPIDLVLTRPGRLAQGSYRVSLLSVEPDVPAGAGEDVKMWITALQLANQLAGGGRERQLTPSLRERLKKTGHGAVRDGG